MPIFSTHTDGHPEREHRLLRRREERPPRPTKLEAELTRKLGRGTEWLRKETGGRLGEIREGVEQVRKENPETNAWEAFARFLDGILRSLGLLEPGRSLFGPGAVREKKSKAAEVKAKAGPAKKVEDDKAKIDAAKKRAARVKADAAKKAAEAKDKGKTSAEQRTSWAKRRAEEIERNREMLRQTRTTERELQTTLVTLCRPTASLEDRNAVRSALRIGHRYGRYSVTLRFNPLTEPVGSPPAPRIDHSSYQMRTLRFIFGQGDTARKDFSSLEELRTFVTDARIRMRNWFSVGSPPVRSHLESDAALAARTKEYERTLKQLRAEARDPRKRAESAMNDIVAAASSQPINAGSTVWVREAWVFDRDATDRHRVTVNFRNLEQEFSGVPVLAPNLRKALEGCLPTEGVTRSADRSAVFECDGRELQAFIARVRAAFDRITGADKIAAATKTESEAHVKIRPETLTRHPSEIAGELWLDNHNAVRTGGKSGQDVFGISRGARAIFLRFNRTAGHWQWAQTADGAGSDLARLLKNADFNAFHEDIRDLRRATTHSFEAIEREGLTARKRETGANLLHNNGAHLLYVNTAVGRRPVFLLRGTSFFFSERHSEWRWDENPHAPLGKSLSLLVSQLRETTADAYRRSMVPVVSALQGNNDALSRAQVEAWQREQRPSMLRHEGGRRFLIAHGATEDPDLPGTFPLTIGGVTAYFRYDLRTASWQWSSRRGRDFASLRSQFKSDEPVYKRLNEIAAGLSKTYNGPVERIPKAIAETQERYARRQGGLDYLALLRARPVRGRPDTFSYTLPRADGSVRTLYFMRNGKNGQWGWSLNATGPALELPKIAGQAGDKAERQILEDIARELGAFNGGNVEQIATLAERQRRLRASMDLRDRTEQRVARSLLFALMGVGGHGFRPPYHIRFRTTKEQAYLPPDMIQDPAYLDHTTPATLILQQLRMTEPSRLTRRLGFYVQGGTGKLIDAHSNAVIFDGDWARLLEQSPTAAVQALLTIPSAPPRGELGTLQASLRRDCGVAVAGIPEASTPPSRAVLASRTLDTQLRSSVSYWYTVVTHRLRMTYRTCAEAWWQSWDGTPRNPVQFWVAGLAGFLGVGRRERDGYERIRQWCGRQFRAVRDTFDRNAPPQEQLEQLRGILNAMSRQQRSHSQMIAEGMSTVIGRLEPAETVLHVIDKTMGFVAGRVPGGRRVWYGYRALGNVLGGRDLRETIEDNTMGYLRMSAIQKVTGELGV